MMESSDGIIVTMSADDDEELMTELMSWFYELFYQSPFQLTVIILLQFMQLTTNNNYNIILQLLQLSQQDNAEIIDLLKDPAATNCLKTIADVISFIIAARQTKHRACVVMVVIADVPQHSIVIIICYYLMVVIFFVDDLRRAKSACKGNMIWVIPHTLFAFPPKVELRSADGGGLKGLVRGQKSK